MQDMTGTLIYVMGLMAVFYFLFVAPQKKQQKKRAEVMAQVEVGSEIVTIGGLVGTVTYLDDQIVKINVGNGVVLTFMKTAIAGPKSSLIKEAEEEVSIDDLEDYMDEPKTEEK